MATLGTSTYELYGPRAHLIGPYTPLGALRGSKQLRTFEQTVFQDYGQLGRPVNK